MLKFPEISPVLLQIGPLALRWYGLMYAISFFVLVTVMRRQSRTGFLPLGALEVERLFLLLVACILGGARLFYLVFYNPVPVFSEPAEIIAMWHGGMSFHGGLVGIAAASFWMARRAKIPWSAIVDTLALCGPIGIALGRVGNFINGELYGRVTSVPWGMIFPQGGPLPRHPSQLYESFCEGVLLAVLLWGLKPRVQRHGVLTGAFLVGYGFFRIALEFFREPDAQLGFVWGPFTMGQILSLGVLLPGFAYLAWSLKRGPEIRLKTLL